jgi:hypothetical protein
MDSDGNESEKTGTFYTEKPENYRRLATVLKSQKSYLEIMTHCI